jgi:hypothetical protein
MRFNEGIDEVPILNSPNLRAIAGSHIEHVVPIDHKLLVFGKAEERSHSFKHHTLAIN